VRESALDRLEPAQLDHHSGIWTGTNEYKLAPGATRFEFFETNMGLRIGLGVAARYAMQWGLPAIEERVTGLAARLRTGLRAIPGVTVHDRGQRLSGIVTFTVASISPADLIAHLHAQSINVWMSKTVSGRLDLEEKGLEQVSRASVHYYNSEAEIDRLCSAIEAL
jgi:selenocysteine lyase/cysteine desulfurase